MKHLFLALLLLALHFSWAQAFNLKECVVIAQFEKPEDRYALEVNLCEIFTAMHIKAIPATNFVKQGGSSQVLATDSSLTALKEKGFSTYCLVNVKGFDNRFKKSEHPPLFSEGLDRATIYNLYKDEISNLTLEFIFYREGKPVFNDVYKISNIGDRDDVIKRLKKKGPKYFLKNWFS